MEERKHPNHKIIWITIVVLLIVFSLVFLFLALYNHHPLSHDNHATQTLGVIFMFLLGSAGFVGVLGAYFSKCTECNSWIKRHRNRQKNNAKIEFLCKRCNILFDSGIEESTS